ATGAAGSQGGSGGNSGLDAGGGAGSGETAGGSGSIVSMDGGAVRDSSDAQDNGSSADTGSTSDSGSTSDAGGAPETGVTSDADISPDTGDTEACSLDQMTIEACGFNPGTTAHAYNGLVTMTVSGLFTNSPGQPLEDAFYHVDLNDNSQTTGPCPE